MTVGDNIGRLIELSPLLIDNNAIVVVAVLRFFMA
jgi:hypothetical protein